MIMGEDRAFVIILIIILILNRPVGRAIILEFFYAHFIFTPEMDKFINEFYKYRSIVQNHMRLTQKILCLIFFYFLYCRDSSDLCCS